MAAKRFRTKPVEIEAIQFDGENYKEIQDWIRDPEATGDFIGYREPEILAFKSDGSAYWGAEEIIANVYDVLHASWIGVKKGQWIVRGAKGEYYPCDDETFHWKYEEVPAKVNKVRVQRDPDDPARGFNPFGPPADNTAFYDSYYKEGHQ